MLSFCLFIVFTTFLVLLSIEAYSVQLSALFRSKYVYSAFTSDSFGNDDYYTFSSTISFSLTKDSDRTLNADVLMQTNETCYTDALSWNAQILSPNRVAVSKNIADKYNLQIGDHLYSKHNVNGTVVEYTIDQILTSVNCARVTGSLRTGLVIVGYDDTYVNNLSHEILFYDKENLNNSETRASSNLRDIKYREDELAALLKIVLPYLIVVLVLSIVTTIVYVWLSVRDIEGCIKWLAALGSPKKQINSSYYRFTYGNGLFVIALYLLFSSALILLCKMCAIDILVVLFLAFVMSLSLLISGKMMNQKLWR